MGAIAGLPVTGELVDDTTATQFPSVNADMVMVKAKSGNGGSVYVGVEGVAVPDGASDQLTGLELAAGETTGWIPVNNLDQLWLIAATNGDGVTYMAIE